MCTAMLEVETNMNISHSQTTVKSIVSDSFMLLADSLHHSGGHVTLNFYFAVLHPSIFFGKGLL